MAEVCLRVRGLGTGGESASRRPGVKITSPMKKIFHGISHDGLGKNLASDSASEWKHGTARKNLAGSAIGSKKSSPMKKFSLGDMRRDLEKNRQGAHCIGVKTSGPENNPPAAGSAETSLPRWKIFHGISHDHDGLRKIGYSSGNMGGSEKNRPGRRSAQKKSSPMKKFYAFGLRKKKNGRRQCIGVKTSGPENNPPSAGSAKTFLPRCKSCPCQRCVF